LQLETRIAASGKAKLNLRRQAESQDSASCFKLSSYAARSSSSGDEASWVWKDAQIRILDNYCSHLLYSALQQPTQTSHSSEASEAPACGLLQSSAPAMILKPLNPHKTKSADDSAKDGRLGTGNQ
jgi:hypothetical protein